MDHQTAASDLIVPHAAVLGLVAGTLIGALPAVAAIMAVIWYMIAIWESQTVRGLRVHWRRRREKKQVVHRWRV